jgi:hypothetical protein
MTSIGGKPPQTPKDMEAWEKLVPGSANKLFNEYICQLQHRRKLDKLDMVLSFYGPALGFLVVLAFLGVSGWLINRGFGIEGTVLGSVDIASLAAVFAIGRQKSEERRAVNDVALNGTSNDAGLGAASLHQIRAKHQVTDA